MNILVKNSGILYIIGSKVIIILLTLLTNRLLTEYLSETELGKYYYFLSLQTLFVITLISPVGQILYRKAIEWRRIEILNSYINIHFLFIAIIASISFLILISFKFYFDNMDFKTLPILLPIFILVNSLNQTYIPLLNLFQDRKGFALISILTTTISLLLGYIILRKNSSAFSWVLILSISYFCTTILGFSRLKSRFINGNVKENIFTIIYSIWLRKGLLLKLVGPLSIGLFLMWFIFSGYRLIIESIVGLEFLGLLGLGFMLSSQISSSIESITESYLTPLFYEKLDSKKSIKCRTEWFNYFLNKKFQIYSIISCSTFCLSPFLYQILVSDYYSDYYIYLQYGVILDFFRKGINAFYQIALIELKTKNIIVPYVIGAMIISCGFILYNFSGSQRLILSSLILGVISTFIMMYIKMNKILRINLQLEKIFQALIISFPLYAFSTLVETNSTLLAATILILAGFYLFFVFFYLKVIKIY